MEHLDLSAVRAQKRRGGVDVRVAVRQVFGWIKILTIVREHPRDGLGVPLPLRQHSKGTEIVRTVPYVAASAVRWEGKGRGHRVVFGQIHHESPAWSNVVDVSRKHWSPHVRPSEEHRPTTIAHVRGGQIAQNRSLRRTQTLVCIVPTVTVHVSVGRIARAVTVQVTRHARVEQSIGAAGAFIEVRPAVVVVIEVLGQRRRAGVGQSIGPTVSIGVFRGTCVPWESILMIQHAVVVVVVVPEVLDAVAVRVWVAQIEVNRAVHHRVRSRVGGFRDLTVEAAYLRCTNAEHLCVHAKEAGPIHVLNATTKGRGFDAAIVALG